MLEELNITHLWAAVKILSLPAALKLYIWLQGLRSYGVYTLYKKRDDIFKHQIFSTLDKLTTDEELFNRIPDLARREIFKDIFKIEVYGLNDILLAFRDLIYVDKSFWGFMNYHRHLDSQSLVEMFLRLYNAHRDKLRTAMYTKLRKGGLEKEVCHYITQKFYDFTAQNSYILRERIEIQKTRNNLYFSIMDILQSLQVEIESEKIFLPIKFSTLNGKLDNVLYKSYKAFAESKQPR